MCRIFLLLFIYTNTIFSQTGITSPNIIISSSLIKRNTYGTDEIADVIKNYHKKVLVDPYYTGEFWTQESKASYNFPGYMLIQEFAEYWNYDIVPNLITLFKPDSNLYTAQVGYSVFEKGVYKGTFCVYTHALKIENDTFRLFPIIETYKYKILKNEMLSLFITDTIQNNNYLFDSLQKYNNYLAILFQTLPVKFKCYKFRDHSEMHDRIGLDVQRNYSRTQDGGYCDMYNKIIYSTNNGNFFHELVHMYVGNEYLTTHHPWINEGLATMLGGSQLSLEEHLHYLSIDLNQHSKYNLNNFLDYDGYFIDNSTNEKPTNYKFTLGGLICKLIYQKYGFEGIKKLLLSGSKNEDLYLAVESILKVKRKDFNSFFRTEIKKYQFEKRQVK